MAPFCPLPSQPSILPAMVAGQHLATVIPGTASLANHRLQAGLLPSLWFRIPRRGPVLRQRRDLVKPSQNGQRLETLAPVPRCNIGHSRLPIHRGSPCVARERQKSNSPGAHGCNLQPHSTSLRRI